MQMPKSVKKIWDTVTTVLVVLVVVFAVFLMGSRLVGLQVQRNFRQYGAHLQRR